MNNDSFQSIHQEVSHLQSRIHGHHSDYIQKYQVCFQVQKGYQKGLTIKASEGDFIRFAKPINIYENNLTKLIYFNLVQMDQKVKNIDIRITDCYNPDLYLDILYKRGSKEILC